MCIWVISTLNRLEINFIRGSYTKIKFSKKEVFSGKNSLFVIGPLFCSTFNLS